MELTIWFVSDIESLMSAVSVAYPSINVDAVSAWRRAPQRLSGDVGRAREDRDKWAKALEEVRLVPSSARLATTRSLLQDQHAKAECFYRNTLTMNGVPVAPTAADWHFDSYVRASHEYCCIRSYTKDRFAFHDARFDCTCSWSAGVVMLTEVARTSPQALVSTQHSGAWIGAKMRDTPVAVAAERFSNFQKLEPGQWAQISANAVASRVTGYDALGGCVQVYERTADGTIVTHADGRQRWHGLDCFERAADMAKQYAAMQEQDCV